MSTQEPATSLDKPSMTLIEALLASDLIVHERAQTNQDVDHVKDRTKFIEVSNLFLKPIRPNANQRERDFFCELICSNLGQHLDLPIPWQVPIDHPELGPTLVSRRLEGEDNIAVNDPAAFANGDDLAKVCVFEEWVMNSDDKQQHFWAVPTPDNGRRVCIVDHGHTLHHPHNIDGPDDVTDFGQIHDSVGKNPYSFTTVDDVRDGIDMVQRVDDPVVKAVVDRSLEELHRMDTDDSNLTALVDEAQTPQETVVRILRERRDNIETIMQRKFGE